MNMHTIYMPDYAAIAAQYAHQAVPLQTTSLHVLIIDPQLCFTHPQSPLFVKGQSGDGAYDDMVKLRDWIKVHLDKITDITVSLDDHSTMQIFHPGFWINAQGTHPDPFTNITHDDVLNGRWLPVAAKDGRAHTNISTTVLQYLKHLEHTSKQALIIWPYHALRGTISSAIDPILEEALFAHSIYHQRDYTIIRKGQDPLSEQYAAFELENGMETSRDVLQNIFAADTIIVTGEAKSHCLAKTVDSMMLYAKQEHLDVTKIHVLTDTTSNVVTPAYDYTEDTERLYMNFATQGIRMITTKTPLK